MIELNEKTQQDFLNREWVQKLLDAGVDMSDAKYFISKIHDENDPWIDPNDKDGIFLYEEVKDIHWGKLHSFIKECVEEDIIDWKNDTLPTYTVSELLYKLHEWIYPIINGIKYSGGLKMIKDAPFYLFYYDLTYNYKNKENPLVRTLAEFPINDYIYADYTYPIESLASLLIQCHKKDIGLKAKDTGNISDK